MTPPLKRARTLTVSALAAAAVGAAGIGIHLAQAQADPTATPSSPDQALVGQAAPLAGDQGRPVRQGDDDHDSYTDDEHGEDEHGEDHHSTGTPGQAPQAAPNPAGASGFGAVAPPAGSQGIPQSGSGGS